MPTKTAVKEPQSEPAVEEVEEGITPTPSDPPAETEPEEAKSVKPAKKAAAKKPPSLEEIQRGMYPEDAELWVGTLPGLPEKKEQPEKMVFVFPKMNTLSPNRAFLRRIYNLEPLFQYFEWMNLAGIPPFIQDLTDVLTDDQFNDLFEAWFTNTTGDEDEDGDEGLDPPK